MRIIILTAKLACTLVGIVLKNAEAWRIEKVIRYWVIIKR